VTSPLVIPPTLGRRIADCRERRGWTQKALAERAKLSVTFVSEVENDHRVPGAEALLHLSEALEVSLDYLMKGELDRPPVRQPLVLPPALADVAEEDGWSVDEAIALLKSQRVRARRSGGDADRELTKNEWRQRHRHLFEDDSDGGTGA
jgi:transcriptional regulator with XRE-family HTH domain